MEQESGRLDAEISHRQSIERRFVPGATFLDGKWKQHEAKAAGEVAVDADEDRRVIEQDARGPVAPGATAVVQRDLAEAEQLATDAIDAGLRVSQDALDANVAHRDRNVSAAEAAEAAAQTDLGRASRDLAAEDALVKEVQADTQGPPPRS
jgi:hypothetical protein